MFQPAANSKDTDYSLSAGFLFNRKLRSLLNKTLRGMRTRAKWIFVAKATALGARVPQAELIVPYSVIIVQTGSIFL